MVQFTAITESEGSWTYEWASGLGEVRVVLWGEELATTTENSYTYTSEMYNSPTLAPPVEVVLAGELAQSEHNRCYLSLQWYRNGFVLVGSEIHHYEVEYYNGTTWVSRGSVVDNPDTHIIVFNTPVLPDMVEALWRVTAVSVTDRESDVPLEFSYMVVRPPTPPALPTLACVGGTLTISE